MSTNILASLANAGNSLAVFEQALAVIQNNVNNSSTPGYATQTLNLEAQPLVVTGGLAGGVAAQGLEDSRDQYAEEQVQQQTQTLGLYTAQAQATGSIQSLFDVSGTGGVSGALNTLISDFSALSTTPDETVARQTVLTDAGALASSVNGLSASLSGVSEQLDGQIGTTVDQINSIATQIQQYNVGRLQSSQPDPGADAQLYSALDNLSQLTNFTTVTQTDGTVTVMLGGGSPLVIGSQQYSLKASDFVDTNPPAANPQSPPTAHILDSQGNDITSQVTSGQLGGLLDTKNRVLASILGDSQQAGSLNQFAKTLADTVNQVLESGTVSSDPGAANGTALFTYDASDATAAAGSLALNPAITAAELASGDVSPVAIGTVSNGIIAPGAKESFTVNTASGSSTFTITGASGDTAATQLSELNSHLSADGISASLDNGKLAFNSSSAYSVSVSGAGLAGNGDSGINTALNNGSLSYVASDPTTQYTVTEGSTTATINLGTGLTDSSALGSINSQLNAQGITDITAVADGSGKTGAFSLQGDSIFTDAVTTGSGVAGSVNAAAGGSANNTASQLASLGSSNTTLGTIGGLNLVQYLAQIASGAGQENQVATTNQQTQQQVAAQASTLRDQVSGVSLDEQAVDVLQFQRSYQAAAQVLTVLNALVDTTLDMMPPAGSS
jgi:flagellar hook-associated protein 1 FlgK